jgi:hypothetical protein
MADALTTSKYTKFTLAHADKYYIGKKNQIRKELPIGRRFIIDTKELGW